MEFRTATNKDGDAVRALVRQVLEEYGLPPDPGKTDACLDDIEANYLGRGGIFEVIVEGGRILGCYGLYPLSPDTCELRKMYFLPELRGRGVGRDTMTRALRLAKDAGFRRIELETAGPLKEAVGLYRKFGFQEFTKNHIPDRCDRAMFLTL
jgi:putative acetyltransferase